MLRAGRERVVVIGHGAAAVEGCRGLREGGFEGEVLVFAVGGHPVYNPMLTSYFAAGRIDYAGLFPYGRSDDVFRKYRAALRPHEPALALSVRDRTVTTADGRVHPFDRALIASGASPLVPPIPGLSNVPNIFTLRTVEDALALREALARKPRRALVVGASMVGLKAVELFLQAGLKVALADMADRVFPLAAHPDCSRIIERRLAARGLEMTFGAILDRVEETAAGLRAFFRGRPEPLEADLILIAVGVRANLGFADRREIEIGQGVLVDRRLESSVPGICAAGDAAQVLNLLTGRKQVIGLWGVARRQGYAAGRHLAGAPSEYAGEILHNLSHFMGMDFVGLGEFRDCDRVETRGDGGRFAQVFYRDGCVRGANFLDWYTEAGVFKSVLEKYLLTERAAAGPLAGHLLRDLWRPSSAVAAGAGGPSGS